MLYEVITQIRAGLELEEVNCDHLVTLQGRRSQTAFIAVEPQTARRTIFWHRGDAVISPAQLDEEQIASASYNFV